LLYKELVVLGCAIACKGGLQRCGCCTYACACKGAELCWRVLCGTAVGALVSADIEEASRSVHKMCRISAGCGVCC
jgi:hypothetical protein